MSRIPTVAWRGVHVSRDMIDPLNELAASVRPWVSPIPGYGSYRKNAASGGTDNGSGHLDIYARTGWTQADRDLFVANARRMGFMAFYRPPTWWSQVRQRTISGGWAHHFHLILKDSDDLSRGARNQLSQWFAGSNGLAPHNGRYDPDPGPRAFIRQTWAQYAAIKAIAGEIVDDATSTPTATSPVTSSRDWFDMATEADLARVVRREIRDYDFLREVARFVLTGYNFDHDGVAATPDAVLAVAMRDLRLATGSTRAMLIDALSQRLGVAAAEVRKVLEEILGVEPATPDPEPEPPAPPVKTGPSLGVDVSGHQSVARVAQAAADPKYDFIIIKATEGMGFRADTYAAQRAAAGAKFLGAYHFAWPNQDPAKEVDNFLAHAALKPGECAFLDVENWGGRDAKKLMAATPWSQRVAFALAWCDAVKDRTGAIPAVYANWDWIKNFRAASTVEQWQRLVAYPLWIADYDFGPGKHPSVDPKPGTGITWPVLLHQWTSNDGGLDGNWAGDLPAVRALGVTRASA